ncbi:MAG: 16S rRNA (cytosine(1402)-N(4))-methyltransferase RsmH [Candidatus Eremiobacteraeota bacterium]|nr:16S rRNA (cytosine(1402)-N(4))-methyltransferase RsmH [Candidatus Eremiobacteraeota bacterium]
MKHVPVLLGPALDYLAIRSDGIYVDATYGAGGHSRAILERLDNGRLLAFDVDPAAQLAAIVDSRFELIRANFRDLSEELDRRGIATIDGILFDLGVSSMQFDDPERGFSLGKTASLDMRMNPYGERNAYDILATASERELADIFFRYGEEQAARHIARAVVARRSSGTLPTTTTEFAALVAGVLHRRGHRERIHPATRVFQALRITVNDELSALRDGLGAAIGRLRAAGRIVAISFHSLEDRIVKQTFRDDNRLDVITRKPLVPTDHEIAENARARSAKLRAAKRKAS